MVELTEYTFSEDVDSFAQDSTSHVADSIRSNSPFKHSDYLENDWIFHTSVNDLLCRPDNRSRQFNPYATALGRSRRISKRQAWHFLEGNSSDGSMPQAIPGFSHQEQPEDRLVVLENKIPAPGELRDGAGFQERGVNE
jgi:hypothetical protein